jgi:flagellar FliL protein
MVDERIAEDVEEIARPKAEKKFPLIPVILGANALVIGVVLFLILYGRSPSSDSSPSSGDNFASSGAAASIPTSGIGVGPKFPLDTFIVNLYEPVGTRYLKVTMELELSSNAAVKELEKRRSQVSNIIIDYLSSLTYSETIGPTAKENIRQSIMKRINNVMKTGRVVAVFFTEFIIQ